MKDLNQTQGRSTIEDFDLLQCIDRGLEKFGRSVKQSIYWKISILYGSPEEAILSKPETFLRVIRTTFRDSSAGIEKHLFDEIESKMGHFKDCSNLEDTLVAMKDHVAPVNGGTTLVFGR